MRANMTFTKIINGAEFLISTDPNLIDPDAVYQYLSSSYWANNRSYEDVMTSIRHSLCFGLYHKQQQIGFARILTDYVTHAYLMDVYVLSGYQSQGLGQWLLQAIIHCDELSQVNSWILATKDAHGFYEKFGFKTIPYPERIMVRNKVS
jgi:GNAT superfamily N-acetyltransferase